MVDINFKRLDSIPTNATKGNIIFVKNSDGNYTQYLVEDTNKLVEVFDNKIVNVSNLIELEATPRELNKLYIVQDAEYNDNGVGEAIYRVVNGAFVVVSQSMKSNSLVDIYERERGK